MIFFSISRKHFFRVLLFCVIKIAVTEFKEFQIGVLTIGTVLDGFIDLVREEQQRSRTQREKLEPSRPSVRDKLKQELPAHKSAAPKKREPER